MTDTTDPREGGSEYAELLDFLRPETWADEYNIHKHVAATMRDASVAIRALEAKVRVEARRGDRWQETAEKFRGERDRLAGEVERLQQAIKRQAASARMGMDAATKISAGQLREAARLHAESQPAAVESERAANEMLTAEVARLISELAAARENEARYLWLRDAEGEDYAALLDRVGRLHEGARLDQAIDAARRAGEGEE